MNVDFEGQLAALRQKFRERAAAQSVVLEDLACDLEDGPRALPHRTEIKRIAHSLAGAGGTFGFAEISARAAELEDYLSDAHDLSKLAGVCRSLVLEIKRATQRGSD